MNILACLHPVVDFHNFRCSLPTQEHIYICANHFLEELFMAFLLSQIHSDVILGCIRQEIIADSSIATVSLNRLRTGLQTKTSKRCLLLDVNGSGTRPTITSKASFGVVLRAHIQ